MIDEILPDVHKIMEEQAKMSDRFHKHLDGCKHCEKYPFDLCAEGFALMMGVAEEAF